MNMAYESVDRWAENPEKCDRNALIFEKSSTITTVSYRQLKEKSCQWANLLIRYGFETGDRLFVFLPPCPEIYFSLIACARTGVVFCPLYSASTHNELGSRLTNGRPRAILTHPDLVEMIPEDCLEGVAYVFLLEGPLPDLLPNELLLAGITQQMPVEFYNVGLPKKAPLYLCYTSGSTGPPKGVVHTHGDMVGILASGRYVLDLKESDILWSDADPAWVTGMVYGVLAPWLCGGTALVQGDPFEPANWYWTLEKHKVSICYTTPKTLMRLREAGDNLASRYDLSQAGTPGHGGRTPCPGSVLLGQTAFKSRPP